MTGGKDNVFALRVKGTSMIDALVNDGDLVLMEQTELRPTTATWSRSGSRTARRRR